MIDNSNAGKMVYLSNLPSFITTEMLIEVCKKYGRVIDCYLQPNADSGEIEGYVEFQSIESVRQLVCNPITIHNHTIETTRCRPAVMKWRFVEEERKDTVYVSNLDQNMDKITLRELFETYGKIKDIRLQFKPNYAFAYIQFANEKEATDSCSLDKMEIGGKAIGVAISNPAKRTKHEIDRTQLYITNLPKSITEPDLEAHFKEVYISD